MSRPRKDSPCPHCPLRGPAGAWGATGPPFLPDSSSRVSSSPRFSEHNLKSHSLPSTPLPKHAGHCPAHFSDTSSISQTPMSPKEQKRPLRGEQPWYPVHTCADLQAEEVRGPHQAGPGSATGCPGLAQKRRRKGGEEREDQSNDRSVSERERSLAHMTEKAGSHGSRRGGREGAFCYSIKSLKGFDKNV